VFLASMFMSIPETGLMHKGFPKCACQQGSAQIIKFYGYYQFI
jgi:hypothetical protein